MRKLGFSLVELIIVVLIIGIVSFLAVKLPSFYLTSKISDLLDELSPNGEIVVYKNDDIVSNKKVVFDCNNPEVFEFINGEFEKKLYEKEDEKTPVFKYKVVNGVGDSFILKCQNGWYVFKPFSIKKAKTEKEAEEMFLNKKYFPKIGSYY
ncbi:prepilin-type N-terminal cleavage/methylation domain-containing protein [Nautilia lithotrophica]